MKIFLLVILNLPLLLIAQEKGVAFEKELSWNQMKSKAKEENKYIFVDVFATWCGPCKQMDKEVYTDPKVGKLTNEKFLSVKLQMDSTRNDDDYIRSWYNTAKQINKEFQVQGFPSFLFFGPDGTLVYRDIGYKSVPEFLIMINLALDPNGTEYYKQIEDYKNGKRDFSKLRDLAVFLRHVAKRNVLADSIATDYKEKYLNRRIQGEMLKKENLDFMAEFIYLVNTKDLFFEVCYNIPDEVDSVENQKGWAKSMVERVITNSELNQKLFTNERPVTKHPKWREISNRIKRNYSKVNTELLLLNYQVKYYRFFDSNWEQWVRYKNEKIKKYPPRVEGFGIYAELNVFGAWDAFLNCNNKRVLRETLDWINTAIKSDSVNRAAYYDTKANILYKLGEIDAAIGFQTKAIELAGNETDRVSKERVKELMQKLEPTYLWENAIWTENTLPKKRY